ncbi:MAG: helix-turn-helix domain-containing protein [Deltaproteobacteria bacterium]|jgi:transcriptional regulator GlxA family with amidase domain|nr:helix-turn-helix domain-containing protein [Deltaproteobacteria bacterium]
MLITIAASEGLTDSGLSIALDVLRAANAIYQRTQGGSAPFRVSVASRDGRPVTLASGLQIAGLRSDRQCARSELWLVPGAWAETNSEVERWLAGREFGRLAHTLERAAGRGAKLYGSCTGVYAIAATGILDGLEATTSWWLTKPFLRAFPKVKLDPRQALIAHRRVATAGAVFAQADLALHLVRTALGPNIGSLVTRYLLLDEHPAQASYMALTQIQADDPLLRRAEVHLRRHLPRLRGVPELAKAIGASPRTLARRTEAALGLSPGRWLRRLRVEEAARQLQTTTTSIADIAEDVGLGSAATLRRELRRELGRSPRELRLASSRGSGSGSGRRRSH